MTELITPPARATFRAMSEGTFEDWEIIRSVEPDVPLSEGILEQLRRIGEAPSGFAVDRTTHSLQTATRAERAGRSDDYVLAALLHDIGDNLGPENHSEVAGAILRPHLPEDLHWMVQHHGEFQLYYFGHFTGQGRNVRDRHAGHPHYDLTAEFCEEYDQRSFDPDYPTEPIEHFLPLVRDKIR
ncbi:MAG TPA: HD domain-containing protein [Acidimicrobiales bacterium]|nr:HD domain-containing protein [Acidimicrobiales bacterium]